MLFYGSTDVGMRRAVNQDNFIIRKYSDDVIFAVVCDGMGGAAGGSIASRTAAEAFCRELEAAETTYPLFSDLGEEEIAHILVSAAEEANHAVYKMAQDDEELSGMGTTLVGCLAVPGRIYTVNVGDSRMYMDKGDGMFQVTRDHSYVQYLVDMGKLSKEEARASKKKNIITRAVGTERTVEVDFFVTEYDGNAVMLLCSDGLTNHVEEAELEVILRGADSEEGIQKACEEMISCANSRGGTDNITAVVIVQAKEE
ncbi:MAG: Stp1/IreP family PP2C-type Ser/Thr phosphatase [Ruminococcaceae bacterium]|nr:Stp1/IreP family PP2C-type Ser/Thr phosphatase [Oscillospiraceae bacterium]